MILLEDKFTKRKRTRLIGYDYSKSGAYFITICTHNRKNILSDIVVGEGSTLPQLKEEGRIIEKTLLSVGDKYPCIRMDKFIIMPNHIHIILCIENNGRGNPSPTISNVIGWIKYNATKQINEKNGIQNKIFQRSFHDHIIRGEKDYLKIWNYIDTNAQKWKQDCFYSEN